MTRHNFFDELYRDIKFNRKKFILFIITIGLFITGYLIAPKPHPDGLYTVQIEYNDVSVNFDIYLDSSINFPLNNKYINNSINDILIEVNYFEIYPGIIGESIVFDVILSKNNEYLLDIDSRDIIARLDNNGDSTIFSPSNIEDENISFRFRILKNSNVALGLLLAISFLWLTELIPLAASSLIIPVVIVISKIDGATGAFANFANPIIFLFLAGFLMAEAMDRSRLDKYISLRIVALVPAKPKILMATFMVLSAVFSMFMSNTAAVAILIPIAMTLLEAAEIEDDSYKRAMVLSIAYSATVGGIGTMIGTAPNIIAVEFIKQFNPSIDINFLEWMLFGLPVVIVMLPLVFFYLWFKFKPQVDERNLVEAKRKGLDEITKNKQMTMDQIIVSIIFFIIIALWLTTQYHGISASVVAVIGAILFFFTGQVTNEDLSSIGWPTLITFGGGLSLGYVIIETGLADYIALKLSLMGDLPIMLTTTIVALIALLLTAIASNTASAAILIPIAMPLAVILGINPALLAILVAIACSLDFAIVIGTPPTMMAYNTGLYKVQEIFNIGVVLDLLGLIVVLILTWTLFGIFATII